jgi:hypothetical protein
MIPIGDLIAIITTAGGSLAIVIKLLSMACFQSKCSRIKCCCIEVDRDVKIEQNQLSFQENNNNIQHAENKPQEVHISISDNKSVVERSPNIQIRQLDKE